MLNFRLWLFLRRLRNRILRILNTRLYARLKTSYFLAFIISFFLLFGLLRVLFLFMPNEGYSILKSKNMNKVKNTQLSYLEMEGEFSCYFSIKYVGDIIVYGNDLKINNQIINKSARIEINEISDFYVINGDKYFQYNTVGDADKYTSNYSEYFCTDFSYDNFHNYSTVDINEQYGSYFRFFNNAEIRTSTAYKVYDGDDLIGTYDKFELVGIDINLLMRNKCSIYFIPPSEEKLNINLYRIRNADILCDGTLDFFISSKSMQYLLTNQNVSVVSSPEKNNDVLNANMHFSGTETNFELSGYVHQAKIVGYSIFPNFNDWYFSNIYIIPLSIITALFGGVSLVKKKGKN